MKTELDAMQSEARGKLCTVVRNDKIHRMQHGYRKRSGHRPSWSCSGCDAPPLVMGAHTRTVPDSTLAAVPGSAPSVGV